MVPIVLVSGRNRGKRWKAQAVQAGHQQRSRKGQQEPSPGVNFLRETTIPLVLGWLRSALLAVGILPLHVLSLSHHTFPERRNACLLA